MITKKPKGLAIAKYVTTTVHVELPYEYLHYLYKAPDYDTFIDRIYVLLGAVLDGKVDQLIDNFRNIGGCKNT